MYEPFAAKSAQSSRSQESQNYGPVGPSQNKSAPVTQEGGAALAGTELLQLELVSRFFKNVQLSELQLYLHALSPEC